MTVSARSWREQRFSEQTSIDHLDDSNSINEDPCRLRSRETTALSDRMGSPVGLKCSSKHRAQNTKLEHDPIRFSDTMRSDHALAKKIGVLAKSVMVKFTPGEVQAARSRPTTVCVKNRNIPLAMFLLCSLYSPA
jgi:hypothetical protein